MKVFIIITLTFIINGCDGSASNDFKKAYEKAYDESFRISFKSSFVDSCAKNHDKEQFNNICSCMADDLLSNLSSSELADMDKIKERLSQSSIKKCKITPNRG